MKKAVQLIGWLIILNLVVSNAVQALTNPKLTQTELFERLPKSFVWNFNE